MTTQEQWREIAYQQSLGESGVRGSSMHSATAYDTVYVPHMEATRRADEAFANAMQSGTPAWNGTSGGFGGGATNTGGGAQARRPWFWTLGLCAAGGGTAGLLAWASGADAVGGLEGAWLTFRVIASAAAFIAAQIALLAFEAFTVVKPLLLALAAILSPLELWQAGLVVAVMAAAAFLAILLAGKLHQVAPKPLPRGCIWCGGNRRSGPLAALAFRTDAAAVAC